MPLAIASRNAIPNPSPLMASQRGLQADRKLTSSRRNRTDESHAIPNAGIGGKSLQSAHIVAFAYHQ